ncbi:unnamed protein product, partial [Musa acuminata var. zebrina]
SILLFFLIIIVKRGFSKSRSQHRKSPPGPWKLPFLGSMHHLAGQLPFHAFRDLAAQHGPLILLKIGQVDLAVASSPAAAEEIVKNQNLNFASARIAGYLCSGIAFCPFGPNWKQLHKLCFMELLSTSRIRSFASIRKEETRRLMSDISTSSGTTIKMSEKLSTLTNKIVSRAAFGRGNAHPEPILATIREALDLVLGFYFADVFPSLSFLDYLTGANFKLRRLHRQFDAVLSAIMEEHEANGRDSNEVQHKVDVLLRVKDDPELEIPMTMDNVKAVILDLLVGGTETSSDVLVWVMSELTRNTEAMERE